MDNQKKLRVIFTDRAVLVFSDILKNNKFEESEEDFLNEIETGEESRINISAFGNWVIDFSQN